MMTTNKITDYISDTQIVELQTVKLESTTFFTEYLKLGFNEGVLLKQITTRDNVSFKQFLEGLNKEIFVKNYSGYIFKFTNTDINDLVFSLLHHKGLDRWGLEFEGASDFTDILEEYDSLLKFRKLPCYEMEKVEFQEALFKIALNGSCYGTWKHPKSETRTMVNEFIDILLQNTKNYHLLSIQEWGYSAIGEFACFLVIDIDNATLTFFAKDDYD